MREKCYVPMPDTARIFLENKLASRTVTLTDDLIAKLTRRTVLLREIKMREEEEVMLRKELVASGLFTNLDDKIEGSETIKIANYPGWRLQAGKAQRYNMTNSMGQTETALFELEKTNPSMLDNLVKWKPVLAEGAFKKLPREQQELFTAALTITEGMPTLELLPPTSAMEKEASNG